MKSLLFAFLFLVDPAVRAAENAPPPPAATPTPAARPAAPTAGTGLFENDVLCRGEGFEIRRHELDRAYDQFKANSTLRGQVITPSQRGELEAQLLERLVVTRLLLRRASEADRTAGRQEAAKFITNVIAQAGSEAAFKRQLLAMAFTREDFEQQVIDRAICEEVVDRELAPKVEPTDEQARKQYEANLDRYRRPEMVRVSHILFSTRDPESGGDLSDAKKTEKRALATKVLERAQKGEDFASLAREYSEDPGSKDKGGEYVFPRGQMVPEFEKTAFGLQTNQVSNLVTTQFGFHIIKLLQRIPPETIEFAKAREDILRLITQEEVQKTLLPPFLEQLRATARLEYLNGARPPAPPQKPPPTADN